MKIQTYMRYVLALAALWLLSACSEDTATVTLNVAFEGAGGGTVTLETSETTRYSSSFSRDLPLGQALTLQAEAATGSSFSGWGGECGAEIATCSLTLSGDTSVRVDFDALPERPPHVLELLPPEHGTIRTDDGELLCGSQGERCTLEVPVIVLEIVLEAVADPGYVFSAWQGCASEEATCTLAVTGEQTVSAQFAPESTDPTDPEPSDPSDPEPGDPSDPSPPVDVSLMIEVAGEGELSAALSGAAAFVCRSRCERSYPSGSEIVLSAAADTGSSFGAWGGACAGEALPTCRLTLTEATSVEVSFTKDPKRYRLTVETTGDGQGRLDSEPGAIVCGSVCEDRFAEGTDVRLTAVAEAGSQFVAWFGCPEVSGTRCRLTLTDDTRVSAEFVSAGKTEKTLRVPIRQPSDDAEQYLKAVAVNTSVYSESFVKDAVDIKSGDIDLVHDKLTDADQLVGLRFSDLKVPRAATLTAVYIQFQSDQDYSNTTPTTLYFELEDNPNAETFIHQSVGDISGRVTTGASVLWEPGIWGGEGAATEAERSPNLASLLQPLIDDSSWTNGDNAVAFIIHGSGYRAATSYEDSDGQAELVVSYLE